MQPRVIWIVTDGEGERDHLCLSIAENLGAKPKVIQVDLRWPFTWISTFVAQLCPPQHSPLLSPPWPDLVLAAGRGAIPFVRPIKRQACDYCFVCSVIDPGAFHEEFDLIFTERYNQASLRPNVEVIPRAPVGIAQMVTQKLLEHYVTFLNDGLPMCHERDFSAKASDK